MKLIINKIISNNNSSRSSSLKNPSSPICGIAKSTASNVIATPKTASVNNLA
jgi:hypothetical protein